MAVRKHTEEQIIALLKQADAGTDVGELCRAAGISKNTFYRYKAKYGGMEVSDARRLKALEDENRKLKAIVADQLLENRVLKDIVSKNF